MGLNSLKNKNTVKYISQVHNLLTNMEIYTGKQADVSVMVLLFELQSTVATRANFCVLILKKKKK